MGYAFSVPFILSWTKAISHGITGGRGEQGKKFANTSSRGRVCLFYQNQTTISLHIEYWQDLRHYSLP